MIMKGHFIVFLILCLRYTSCVAEQKLTYYGGSAILSARPCNGSDEIIVQYAADQSPEKEYKYDVFVPIPFPKYSIVKIMLDGDGSIMLHDASYARIIASTDNTFTLHFFEAHDGLSFLIKEKKIGIVPYIFSLNINSQEYCSQPLLAFVDSIVIGEQFHILSDSKKLEGNCGRRKVTHTELIVNGASTKAGDWPWHTAIYRLDKSLIKYICGGTLISKHFVLTAAHCTSIRGVPLLPEVLSVVLGKFNLIGGDTGSEEREVHQIIVHNNFEKRVLDNDIALLKLKTEAVFSDFIQPACLWYSKVTENLSAGKIIGTVVGWGFDNTDTLAHQLRQTNMPLIEEVACIKSNPVFYSKVLTENKFCAGYQNGSSACNGDSGGAFQVFIPDNAQDESSNAEGAWYVRGIVSLTLSRTDVPVCDPTQYVVFTDVDKYRSWIENHLEMSNQN